MTRLVLVRHGETAWNAAGRLQGHTDVPLSPVGQQQADAVARFLASDTVHSVYSSDLQRARQTAQTIAATRCLPVRLDARLRELAFGTWEGLTLAEVQTRDPEGLAAWQADPLRVAPAGGETLCQMAARLRALLTHLADADVHHTAVVVGHGGSLRVLLCLALSLPVSAHWQFALAPGSCFELRLTSTEAKLTRLNPIRFDPARLEGGRWDT